MPYRYSWLPEMLKLDGIWDDILIILYNIFETDFKKGKPYFEKTPVWWDNRILPGEKYEEGFWHLITENNTEDRIPEYQRAKRLPWCTPTIIHSSEIKVWNYLESNRRVRTYLLIEDLDYLIILEKQRRNKGNISFLITAFYIDGDSKKRNLNRKYKNRIV